MSEHVHVHPPHELTESHGESTTRSERVLELIATILLSLATLGIAWSGYQAARWNGRQAEDYAQANTARNLANRSATAGAQNRTQDLLNFNRWLEVTSSSRISTSVAFGPSSSPRSRRGSPKTH
jgi:transposase